MFSASLFLLLTLPGLTRADFSLGAPRVVAVQAQSVYLDYNTALPIAKKLGRNLIVVKNFKDVSEYKAKADLEKAILAVADNDSRFKDGVTEYIFQNDGLYSKESIEVVAKYNKTKQQEESISLDESCSDGSCGVQSSGGFRMSRGASSCSSCQ